MESNKGDVVQNIQLVYLVCLVCLVSELWGQTYKIHFTHSSLFFEMPRIYLAYLTSNSASETLDNLGANNFLILTYTTGCPSSLCLPAIIKL